MLNTPENLTLLRRAVAAKMHYWDAERELEKALAPTDDDFELPDDAVEDISSLAAGLDYPGQAHEMVTSQHLQQMIDKVDAA